MMSTQLEGKYLILKDKQHESFIHWMTGVVLFCFEKPQHNSYQIAFKYLFIYLLFIYLFIYLLINYLLIDLLQYIDNLCIIAMFACVYVGGRS